MGYIVCNLGSEPNTDDWIKRAVEGILVDMVLRFNVKFDEGGSCSADHVRSLYASIIEKAFQASKVD